MQTYRTITTKNIYERAEQAKLRLYFLTLVIFSMQSLGFACLQHVQFHRPFQLGLYDKSQTEFGSTILVSIQVFWPSLQNSFALTSGRTCFPDKVPCLVNLSPTTGCSNYSLSRHNYSVQLCLNLHISVSLRQLAIQEIPVLAVPDDCVTDTVTVYVITTPQTYD